MTKEHVEALIKKAAEAPDGGQAQCYAQAACNAANAMRVIAEIEASKK